MKRFLLLITITIASIQLQAQSQYGIFAGVNIGALVGPINEGDKGAPGIGPNVGVYGNYKLGNNFFFQPSIMYSCTGLQFTASRYDEIIEYEFVFQRAATDSEGNILFDEEGQIVLVDDVEILNPYVKQAKANGKLKTHYIEAPISILWQISKRVGFNIGARVAYKFQGTLNGTAYDVILGETTINDVGSYDFDESDAIKKWDWGLVFGTQVRISPKFAARVQFHSGLTPMNKEGSSAFPDNYYNLYMSTSLAYNIFGKYY